MLGSSALPLAAPAGRPLIRHRPTRLFRTLMTTMGLSVAALVEAHPSSAQATPAQVSPAPAPDTSARATTAAAAAVAHQRWSLSPAAAAPLTVADLIGLASFGSQVQGYGREDEFVISPDGARVAVVIKRGNLARNTVDYTLLLFRTAELLGGTPPRADTVATLASSSNRPAITHVRWLADGTTLTFLGEHPGERPQVYTLALEHRTLTRRTQAAAVITAFDLAAAGEPIVYVAEEPVDTTPYGLMRARGFSVSPGALVSDLIAGDWLTVPNWSPRSARRLHVVRQGRDTTLALPDSAAGYRRCEVNHFMPPLVAPSGDVALIQCTPRVAPAAWAGYRETWFRWSMERGITPAQYLVLDLATGRTHLLTDAPLGFYTNLVWAPDGRSVILANALLPLTGPGLTAADSAARAVHPMVAEVDVHTGAVTVLLARDSLRVQRWSAPTGLVELVPGLYEPAQPGTTTPLLYQKTARGWRAMRAGGAVAPRGPVLRIEQGLNTPPRLVAVDPRTQAAHVVYDPNPGLLTAHRFGREEVIHWTTTSGAAQAGGLYWPPDYVPGRRYPLVIQTHGFDSTAFWPYGVYATGEAAQPLANAGFLVLEIKDPPAEVWVTPGEAPAFQASVEGAIDALDRRGLIDRTRVALQGFSRTCFYTLYFLTHSTYPIAAAQLTDGVDQSYLQSLLFGPVHQGMGRPLEPWTINGGPPWGTSLATWLQRAPGFNLERVTTPLRLTALGPGTLLEEWEPYASLLLQGKPTELVYIPDGEHILIKPWEQLTSQQGAVDWYGFWLQGVEDTDPAKREQYTRWRELRKLQQRQTAGDTAGVRPASN